MKTNEERRTAVATDFATNFIEKCGCTIYELPHKEVSAAVKNAIEKEELNTKEYHSYRNLKFSVCWEMIPIIKDRISILKKQGQPSLAEDDKKYFAIGYARKLIKECGYNPEEFQNLKKAIRWALKQEAAYLISYPNGTQALKRSIKAQLCLLIKDVHKDFNMSQLLQI